MEYMYLFLLCVIVCVHGCTDFSHKPWVRKELGEGTEGKKIYYSDRVLFATVKSLTADPVFKRAGVKAAKLEVLCIYKGGQLHKNATSITVVGTGNRNGEIPGCPPAHLQEDQSYVFFLNHDNKRAGKPYYEVEFEPLGGDPSIMLDDLTIYCGLQREMPAGLPNNEECYEPLSVLEGCEPYDEPTVPPPQKPSTKKPKNNSGGDGKEMNTDKETDQEIKQNDGEVNTETKPSKGTNPEGNKTNGGTGKEINTDKEPGYEANPGETKTNGGKVSGSKDDNSAAQTMTSLTLLIVPLVLMLL